jgi:2-iminobutanoate/2-iminopropanoate deaminase
MQFILNKCVKLNVYLLLITATFAWTAHAYKMDESTDSPYRKAGDLIFISAQVPINPITHQLVSHNVDAQVKQVFENLRQQVITAGSTMNDVVKITVYMDDIDLIFPVVKQYIPKYFNSPYPARSPIGGLSFGQTSGFRVAIDAIVYTKVVSE